MENLQKASLEKKKAEQPSTGKKLGRFVSIKNGSWLEKIILKMGEASEKIKMSQLGMTMVLLRMAGCHGLVDRALG